MQLNLDLGTEMSAACCPAEPPSKSDEPKKYYPSFHYSGDKPLRIPTEGEMVVRYKKVSSEHRTSDDKDHYSCTIEVREIVSVDHEDYEAPAGNKMKDAEEALDAIREAKAKMKRHKNLMEEEY